MVYNYLSNRVACTFWFLLYYG